jgi:hypothetical protein
MKQSRDIILPVLHSLIDRLEADIAKERERDSRHDPTWWIEGNENAIALIKQEEQRWLVHEDEPAVEAPDPAAALIIQAASSWLLASHKANFILESLIKSRAFQEMVKD